MIAAAFIFKAANFNIIAIKGVQKVNNALYYIAKIEIFCSLCRII
jgi:hypothetical protein